MKKLILILSVLFIFTTANSQRLHVVPWYNWSSKTAFMLSPSPIITGYGYHSDSLSRAFDGVTFYEYADEYYPIESWADYYYWYVKAYWWRFNDPGLYEYYYLVKDDFGMAQYICGNNYTGPFYPTRFAVSFPGRSVYVNNLSRSYIRRCIKNDSWENRNYVASKELTAKDNRTRKIPTVKKDYKVRVVDSEKILSKDRDVTTVKYNNSRSNISRTTSRSSSVNQRNGSFEKPGRENSTVNRNTGSSLRNSSNYRQNTNSSNRKSSFSSGSSVNRNTNTSQPSTNRTTNSNQTRSGKTGKR